MRFWSLFFNDRKKVGFIFVVQRFFPPILLVVRPLKKNFFMRVFPYPEGSYQRLEIVIVGVVNDLYTHPCTVLIPEVIFLLENLKFISHLVYTSYISIEN